MYRLGNGGWSRGIRPLVGLLLACCVAVAGRSARADGPPTAGGAPVPRESGLPPKPVDVTGPMQELPDLVVRAERVGTQRVADVVPTASSGGVPLLYAGGRSVIPERVVADQAHGSLVELLRRVPGLHSQVESGTDVRLNVGLRGTDSRRSGLTTLLLDGVPINQAPYGYIDADLFPLTFERVARIDVIRGGAAARYGPNSVGGVVNFVTPDIPRCPTGRVRVRYGSWNEHSEVVSAGGTFDRLGVLATLVERGGDGWRENSAFTVWDGSLKLRYAAGPCDSVSVWGSHYDVDSREPGGLTQAAYDADPSQTLRPNDRLDGEVTIGSGTWTHTFRPGATLDVIVWAVDYARDAVTERPIVAPYTRVRHSKGEFDNLGVEARLAFDACVGGRRNDVYVSARYVQERALLFNEAFPVAGGPAILPHEIHSDFGTDAWALFVEDRVEWTRRWSSSVGARIEHIAMDSESRDNGATNADSFDVVLPEASVTCLLRPWLGAYASYQRSFTPPQYLAFDPTSAFFTPIDPEKADTFEVGLRWQAHRGFEGSVALYHTSYTDKIDVVNTPAGLKQYFNTGKAKNYGLELEVRYDLGCATRALRGLSVWGAYTEQRATIESGAFDGNDAPNAPHRLAAWGARYEHGCGLWTELSGSTTGGAFKEPDNIAVGSADGVKGPQPAFTLWDLSAGYRARPDGRGLSATVGVTNLFDEAYYRRFFSGLFPGTPRAFYVTLGYELRF